MRSGVWGLASPRGRQQGVPAYSVASMQYYCGACGNHVAVEPVGTGLVEFECPRCNAVNQVPCHGVASQEEEGEMAPADAPTWWTKTPFTGICELVAVRCGCAWPDVTMKPRIVFRAIPERNRCSRGLL